MGLRRFLSFPFGSSTISRQRTRSFRNSEEPLSFQVTEGPGRDRDRRPGSQPSAAGGRTAHARSSRQPAPGAAPRAPECGRGQEEEDGVVRLLLAKMPTGFFFFFGTPIMSLSHL